MAHVKITDDIKDVLNRSRIEGNKLFLPEQLDRKLYVLVAKTLQNLGGKWTRGISGFLFEKPVKEMLHEVLDSGISRDIKKDLQAFFTPPELAADIVSMVNVSGKFVLEPSAGEGALARECIAQGAKLVTCVEINPEYAKKLDNPKMIVTVDDFMHFDTVAKYDVVVMNPPFCKNQDVKFVERALDFLKPNGELVAIMGGNTTKKPFQKLLAAIEKRGFQHEICENPEDAFKESGTLVRTVTLHVK